MLDLGQHVRKRNLLELPSRTKSRVISATRGRSTITLVAEALTRRGRDSKSKNPKRRGPLAFVENICRHGSEVHNMEARFMADTCHLPSHRRETRPNRLKFVDTKKRIHKTSGQFIPIYFSLFCRNLYSYKPLCGTKNLVQNVHDWLSISCLVGVSAKGDQLPRVLKIMPPKSLDGDSAQVPKNPRATDDKDPFIERK